MSKVIIKKMKLALLNSSQRYTLYVTDNMYNLGVIFSKMIEMVRYIHIS